MNETLIVVGIITVAAAAAIAILLTLLFAIHVIDGVRFTRRVRSALQRADLHMTRKEVLGYWLWAVFRGCPTYVEVRATSEIVYWPGYEGTVSFRDYPS